MAHRILYIEFLAPVPIRGRALVSGKGLQFDKICGTITKIEFQQKSTIAPVKKRGEKRGLPSRVGSIGCRLSTESPYKTGARSELERAPVFTGAFIFI